jgi:isoleucyl-tRNA synthetase
MFETWYEDLEALQGSAEQRKFWTELSNVRFGLGGLLERLRQDGKIGSSLDATVEAYLPESLYTKCVGFSDELRFFFIISGLKLELLPSTGVLVGPGFEGITLVEFRDTRVGIRERRSDDPKCIRCWHHRPDVGSVPEHPEICGRCLQNLPGGPGETRRYF